VPLHFVGERLDGCAEVADLSKYPRQAPRVVAALAVVLDYGPEALVPVQRRPAHRRPGRDGGKGDWHAVGQDLSASSLDSGQGAWGGHAK